MCPFICINVKQIAVADVTFVPFTFLKTIFLLFKQHVYRNRDLENVFDFTPLISLWFDRYVIPFILSSIPCFQIPFPTCLSRFHCQHRLMIFSSAAWELINPVTSHAAYFSYLLDLRPNPSSTQTTTTFSAILPMRKKLYQRSKFFHSPRLQPLK